MMSLVVKMPAANLHGAQACNAQQYKTVVFCKKKKRKVWTTHLLVDNFWVSRGLFLDILPQHPWRTLAEKDFFWSFFSWGSQECTYICSPVTQSQPESGLLPAACCQLERFSKKDHDHIVRIHPDAWLTPGSASQYTYIFYLFFIYTPNFSIKYWVGTWKCFSMPSEGMLAVHLD